MTGIDSIYVGELIDWHNNPSGGLNGQSGFASYAGSAIAQLNTNRSKRGSIYHLAGVGSSRWLANGVFQPFSTFQTLLNTNHANGMLTLWDWSPWSNVATDFINVRPAAIAAGNWDTQLNTFFAAVAAWGKDVIARIGWEMQLPNGPTPQFPWQFGTTGSLSISPGMGWGGSWTNTISDFNNMWAKIRSLRDANGATNFKMAWVPNRHATSESATTYALIAPPMSQVDWLGVDTYPDYGNPLTDALLGRNAMSYLSNNYQDLCNLDPTKPIMVGEFAWNQSNNTSVGVTSITSTASTFTITVPSQPGTDTWSAGGNAIALDGQTPTAYRNEWDIVSVSGTGPFTIVVNSALNPGTASVPGNARFINRVQTAGLITADLESAGLPTSCPRIKLLCEYHVVDGWPDDHHPLDVDGTHTNSTSFIAYKNAVGNGHYLAGSQIATDTSAFQCIPFQDQPVPGNNTGRPTSQERILDVMRSITGCEGLWPFTEAVGAGSIADVSGKARNGTPVGVTLGATNVVPAEPLWSAISFSGSAGSHIDCTGNAAFSLPTTNKLSFVIPFLLVSTPTAQSTFVSKAGFSGQLAGAVYEYQGWVNGTQIGFTVNNTDGSTWASWNAALPSLNVLHLYIVTIDTSLTRPIVVYLDGVLQAQSSLITAVTLAGGTAPLYFGEKFDNGSHLPMEAGGVIGCPAVYSTALTAESAAEITNVWKIAPIISSVVSTPALTSAAITFNTDIIGSTQIEYGTTLAYGSVTNYDPTRVTSHSASITGLPNNTLYNYRARSRNVAGTEIIGANNTFTTLPNPNPPSTTKIDVPRLFTFNPG